jgi:hypothetical protein
MGGAVPRRRGGGSRWATALAAVAFALLLGAAPASAGKQIMIREVAPFGAHLSGAEFVELQMFADRQRRVDGKLIRFYDHRGGINGQFKVPDRVSNGSSQHTVLLGSTGVASAYGVSPDFVYGEPLLNSTGGAVCYAAVDCVAWGSFRGLTLSLAGPTAEPVPEGYSLERTIERGCRTALDADDDSDDSSRDFALLASPTPRRNTTAPTELPCDGTPPSDRTAPETTIINSPKRVVQPRRRWARAKFEFASSEVGSKFECKLDRRRWRRCSSPKRYKRLKRGRHRFQVRATDAAGNTDLTPAQYRWRVKPGKRR